MAEVNATIPGRPVGRLKIVGSGATERVFLDGKELHGVTAMDIYLEAGSIPTVDMTVYALDVNSETDAEIHLAHVETLASAIAAEVPELSAMKAMEIAQKVLYRIARNNDDDTDSKDSNDNDSSSDDGSDVRTGVQRKR